MSPCFPVFTASGDGDVRVWEMFSGECCRVLRGEHHPINCLAIHQNKLYAGSYDKSVIIWNIQSLLGSKHNF